MDFISILSIFVLACFVGYYVVWSPPPRAAYAADGGDRCYVLRQSRRRACRPIVRSTSMQYELFWSDAG